MNYICIIKSCGMLDKMLILKLLNSQFVTWPTGYGTNIT